MIPTLAFIGAFLATGVLAAGAVTAVRRGGRAFRAACQTLDAVLAGVHDTEPWQQLDDQPTEVVAGRLVEEIDWIFWEQEVAS